MGYIEIEQEARRDKILKNYNLVKDKIDSELWNTPLREYTYDAIKAFHEKANLHRGDPGFALDMMVHKYIHKYKVDLPEDITLEDAILGI